jgi:hypothetical protein
MDGAFFFTRVYKLELSLGWDDIERSVDAARLPEALPAILRCGTAGSTSGRERLVSGRTP